MEGSATNHLPVSANLDHSNDGAQCPVAHAPDQPLPPGHPPTPFAAASTLKPPTGAKCVFFRTHEDLSQTPPISRSASIQLDDVKRLKDAQIRSTSDIDPNTTFVLASRNSQLALVQTSQVSAMLSAHFGKHSPAFAQTKERSKDVKKDDCQITPPLSPSPVYDQDLIAEHQKKAKQLGITSSLSFPYTSMSTGGDQNHTSPLYVIGGEGRAIWTKELEVALAAGAVDAIVHCLKDVPTTLPEGMMLGAILEREDPRDALIIKEGLPYKTLDELPPGSVIGTSSIRRVAQLRRRYPDLVFSDVRGNLITRLAKLDNPNGPYTALVLAAAGLIRLNMGSRITAFLSAPVMMHAVGQGSLTIEVRKPPPGASPLTNRDARILEMVKSIGCWRSTWRQEAERSLLQELEGGCSIPVGVESRFDDHDVVEGDRNEREAIRQVDIGNGDREAKRAPIKQNGHTIPASQFEQYPLGSQQSKEHQKSNDDQPPPLKRLATEKDVRNGKHDDLGGAIPPAQQYMPESSGSLEKLTPEDRASEPERPVHLTLTATVVSLDGSRHCEYSLRQEICSLQQARQLGIDVANELANKRGARVILDEVERHRKLAEEADDLRRKAEREKRIRAAQADLAAATAASTTEDGIESDEERENRLTYHNPHACYMNKKTIQLLA
ncbi:uncharacterized protein FA14DRAFT_170348 [Meira miltonrushii]|uniref:hydroxymethylbilane synthase n=1 Tax=Meira miltonrushii TaxID=1280837 RepID=A0A316VIM8_9BASI|nr:uncharacterized protein FA14DRAFT_170348 [Meira miltonrushii]PWN37517.1 hypothetical protein FA14DRAFT_170348 [Meira miltonrushii]